MSSGRIVKSDGKTMGVVKSSLEQLKDVLEQIVALTNADVDLIVSSDDPTFARRWDSELRNYIKGFSPVEPKDALEAANTQMFTSFIHYLGRGHTVKMKFEQLKNKNENTTK